jgi:hypothetical protein
MGLTQLTGKYTRLREELASAYAAPVWQSGMIDRLTEEILETERALASCQKPLWQEDDAVPRAGDA